MDTKAALLQAAEHAVRRRGYDGFSYADLAREVGIRKPSIHHHFPTKADLGEALIAQYRQRFMATLHAITEGGGPAARQLSSYLRVYRDALAGGDMVCLCVALSSERDSLSEPILATLNAFHTQSTDWLEDVFNAGAQDNSIKNPGAPQAEAFNALALVEGAQLMARAAADTKIFDEATAIIRSRLI